MGEAHHVACSVSGEPHEQIGDAQWCTNFALDEFSEGHVCHGLSDLSERPPIGQRMINVVLCGWMDGVHVGHDGADALVIAHGGVIGGRLTGDFVDASGVRHQVPDGDVPFAVGCKGRPIIGDGVVVFQQTTLSEDVHGNRGNAFAGRPHERHVVGAQGRAGIVARAPGNVHDELTTVVDGELDSFFVTAGDGSVNVGDKVVVELSVIRHGCSPAYA